MKTYGVATNVLELYIDRIFININIVALIIRNQHVAYAIPMTSINRVHGK